MANWCFSDSTSLDFNSGIPVLKPSNIYTWEGCATISDKNGNLLFYTNGITVWDKAHNAMPNGTGLDGNYSTFKCLILQIPDNDSLYYIFTEDCIENRFNLGLRYSVVNIKANANYGDVITKNVLLLDYAEERMELVRHFNGRDYWLLAHKFETDSFYAFKICPNGINPIPVTSKAGPVHQKDLSQTGNGQFIRGASQFRFSSYLNKIAYEFYFDRKILIYDFDKKTGLVSNPFIYIHKKGSIQFDFYKDNIIFDDDDSVYSINIKILDKDSIQKSFKKAYLPYNQGYGAIQSNNGGTYELGRKVILHIDKNFVVDTISKQNKYSGPFASCSYFPDLYYTPDIRLGDNIFSNCFTTFKAIRMNTYDSVNWNICSSIGSAFFSGDNFTYYISDTTQYKITAYFYSKGVVDSIVKKIKPIYKLSVNIGNDTILCNGKSISLNTNFSLDKYLWNTGAITSSINTTTAGTYWMNGILYFTDDCNNTDSVLMTDTIKIGNSPYPSKLTLNTFYFCPDDSFTYQFNNKFLFLSGSDTLKSLTIKKDTVVAIKISNWICEINDTLYFKYTEAYKCNRDTIFIPNAFTPNKDNINDIFKPFFIEYEVYEMKIYDRWGQLLFTSNEMDVGWDGEGYKPDVYVYTISLRTKNKNNITKNGLVQLIR